MTSKIFRSIIVVAGVVLSASFLLIFGVMYSYLTSQLRDELRNEAIYVSKAVEISGVDYLKQLEDSNRITLVGADGMVLYDTHISNKNMENHNNREEIREALLEGVGEDIRYSTTLSEKTIYYAVRMNDGNVLRVAQEQETVLTILLGLVHPLLYILAVMFLLASCLAIRVAKRITEPMNNLDLDHPEQNIAYDEIAPLLTKIHRQKRFIKEQLDEAKRKQQEFEMITENMQEGFLILDPKMEILSCNSSMKQLLGMEEEYQHQNVLKFHRTEKFQKILKNVLNGTHQHVELKFKDIYYQLIANPVFENDGKTVAGAVLIFMDITEKRYGEQIRREFTANVSHELKTPLTSISGFAEIMENGIVKQEDIPKFAGNIFKESQRLISLVNDIIKLSRLDEGDIFYKPEKIDLTALVKQVKERLELTAQKKGVTIKVEGQEAYIDIVPQIAEEIIYNLCDNGIKYNKECGEVLCIIEKKKEGVLFTIKDTGIGIPLSEQGRVFERFYRVDKSHSKEIGGTGLGLSIVKHGIAYLGATMKLESKEGEGTKISIFFMKK